MKKMMSKFFMLVVVLNLSCVNVAWAMLQDPTKPLSYKEAMSLESGGTGILLKSIIYGKNHKVAQIDDKFLKEGDQVNIYTVEKILPSSVILSSGMRKITVPLVKQQIKIKQQNESKGN